MDPNMEIATPARYFHQSACWPADLFDWEILTVKNVSEQGAPCHSTDYGLSK